MKFNKIFGIGLPRTATKSLYLALNELGINTIHFPFSLYETNNLSVLDRYQGFVDTPTPMLYQKLDKFYPNSGFILTTRSIDEWLKSMDWLLKEGRYIWPWRSSYDQFNQEFFGSSEFNLELYQSSYDTFHQEVLSYFQDRNDLLVLDLDVGYGYEELCQFLDVPILSKEYPRENQSRQARWLQKLAYQSGKYHPSLEHLIRKGDYYWQRIQHKLGLM